MNRRFLLIYASQTGQAKAIAEELCEKAEHVGLQADLQCISDTEKKFWLEREPLAVIISSTTGDGDPPDDAVKFVRRLKKKTLPRNHLQQLRYAFLGLGDSNYTNFCNCGKMLDKRLTELGAERFIAASWADDATGLEQVVEPWLESVLPALQKELGVDGKETIENSNKKECMTSVKVTENGDQSNLVNIIVSSNSNNLDTGDRTADKNFAEDQGGTDDIETKRILINKLTKSESLSVNINTTSDSAKDEVDKEKVSDTEKSRNTNTKDKKSFTKDLNMRDIASVDVMDSERKVEGKDEASAKKPSSSSNSQESSLNGSKSQEISQTGPQYLDISRTGSQAQENSPMTGSQTEETSQTGSLTVSLPSLNGTSLSIPICPAAYLGVDFHPEKKEEELATSRETGAAFPSARSAVSELPIVSATRMTARNAVKTALKLQLGVMDPSWEYVPGDSVAILCENTDQEVQSLLDRLSLSSVADTVCTLLVLPGTKKKNAKVPTHYPSPTTLRRLLKYYCDIRAQPKKALLRAFVECCHDAAEKRRLQELCSKQGGEDYTKYIREPALSLLDVLQAFESVQPAVAVILEHCPRLMPRPYSAASSPLKHPGRLDIVFNVVEIPSGVGQIADRQGICTGMLARLSGGLMEESDDGEHSKTSTDLCQLMDGINIQENTPKVLAYLRTNQHFCPPDDLSVPCILIGPGTGVAPFIGFLQHRAAKLEQNGSEIKTGETWLFFGCRHQKRDFLFREELQSFVKSGVLTNLEVSFSRDVDPSLPNPPRYVQDKMKLQGERLASLICDDGARVYVCGDAKGMARNVNQTFVDILQEQKGMTEKEAVGHMMDMRINRRYLEDVWT